jgi:hypothetical protein
VLFGSSVFFKEDINIDIKMIIKWNLTKLYGNIWVGVGVKTLCYNPEGRRFESRMRWIFSIYLTLPWSRDSSVGIGTGYWLDDQGGTGVRVPVWSKIFSSPYHPDRLWGPPNLL